MLKEKLEKINRIIDEYNLLENKITNYDINTNGFENLKELKKEQAKYLTIFNLFKKYNDNLNRLKIDHELEEQLLFELENIESKKYEQEKTFVKM